MFKNKYSIMAIYGAGSKWKGNDLTQQFIRNEYFVVGWDFDDAKDIYDTLSSIDAGDIIYLKANSPGSKRIRVKAIGVVKASLIHVFRKVLYDINEQLPIVNKTTNTLIYLPVKWIITEEFRIEIPEDEGKQTNIRSATLYKEHLQYVQVTILQRLFKRNFKNWEIMDYSLGQFITGVVALSVQVIQLWRDTSNIDALRSKVREIDEIMNSPEVLSEGEQVENIIPFDVLNLMKDRVEFCWTNYKDVLKNPNILPQQIDNYTEGLKECICRELRNIRNINGNLPTPIYEQWWDQYRCEVKN